MRKSYELSEIEQKLLELTFKYSDKNSYQKISLIKEDIFRCEYSKGGEMYLRGFYCPFISNQIQDYKKIGKLVSSKSKYLYKYGFDVTDKLIYVAKADETEEFIFGDNNVRIGLEYHNFYKKVQRITICNYYDCVLMSVDSASRIVGNFDNKSLKFHSENYSYDNKQLTYIERINKIDYYRRFHRLDSVNKDILTYVKEWFD